jgi:hypothetical protein
MYFSDHPAPHFHAFYGRAEAKVAIDPPEIVSGTLPPRQLRLVLAWAELRRDELLANWERARRFEKLMPIEPLR